MSAADHQRAVMKDGDPDGDRRRALARLLIGLVAFVLLSAVAVAWQVTPLRDWLDLAGC